MSARMASAIGKVMGHKKKRAIEELKDALDILENDSWEVEQDNISQAMSRTEEAARHLKEWESLQLDLEGLDQ